jgi:hypothetical protein
MQSVVPNCQGKMFLYSCISCFYLPASVAACASPTCISRFIYQDLIYLFISCSYLTASVILIYLHQMFSTCGSCSDLPVSAVLLYLHQLMEIAGCNYVTSGVLIFHQIKNLSRHIHVRGTNIRVYSTEMLQTQFCGKE